MMFSMNVLLTFIVTRSPAVIRNVCLLTFFIRDAMALAIRLSREFLCFLPLSDRAYVSGA